MSQEPMVEINEVSKRFLLPHEKPTTIKNIFVRPFSKDKKTVETQYVLDDINFTINKGEFFGIVGRNGSGKSTLLKLIAGIYQPTNGNIKVHDRLVPFIELGVGFNPELTGRENVYLNGALMGFSEKEMDEMYDDIVSFAELEKFMDQKLKNYSSGMQVRLAFSVATRAEAGVLLIDEVLAVGDSSFQKKCFEYFRSLKRQRKTVVFVSHDMNAVQEYCDRVAVIDKGKVVCLESADVAAKQYNKLFIGDNYHINRSITKRWGNEKIKFSLPSLEISENGKEIVITSEVIVEEDIKDPVYGFMLADSSGRPVMGTNTSIAGAKVDSAKANQNKKLTWRAPNILSSDTYTLELVLMYEDITVVADWWQDAATIEVVNNHSTPYVVSPPVDFKAERL